MNKLEDELEDFEINQMVYFRGFCYIFVMEILLTIFYIGLFFYSAVGGLFLMGEFKDGKFHGKGALSRYDKNHQPYGKFERGLFKDGKFIKYGKVT